MVRLRFWVYLAVLLPAAFGTSCFKEAECPPMQQVTVAIQDKNYDNVGEISMLVPVDENLPFANYVSSHAVEYAPLDNASGIQNGRTLNLGSQDKTGILSTDNLTDGTYRVTIIGNNVVQAQTRAIPDVQLELHPQQAESNDIYLARDTVRIPLKANQTIQLKRAKGKLIIMGSNFPQNINRVDAKITGVDAFSDGKLSYTGNTLVSKSFTRSSTSVDDRFDLLCAPTVSGGGTLSLFLYSGGLVPETILSNIPVSILRNHISVVKALYDTTTNNWEIWVIADGEWVRLHDMDIQ